MKTLKDLERRGKGRVENLKEELSDKVLVGDFVGNQELANILKYPRETILFHSVVLKTREKESARQNAYCLADSEQILKRLDLDIIPQKVCGQFDNYNSLCDKLEEIYKEVVASSITKSEEGVVLTMVEKGNADQPDSIVSMCQIKSLEYIALRQICETLKQILKDDV